MAGESEQRQRTWGRAIPEIAGIVLLFAASGAWPTPDVNEAVYVSMARHLADPAWGADEFFLDAPDAHGVFAILFGPLAAAVPLETAAWIGRVAGWLALAIGFRLAVAPVITGTLPRLVAAAIFALALRHTTAAGEWMIGGCEAKVFAWAFVLAAVGDVARGRWPRAWTFAGAATALHPIVGGWAMVAIVLARAFAARASDPVAVPRGALAWSALLAGAALAAWGIVPALGLNAGATAAERAQGSFIYVVERLPHHLLPRTFAGGMVARHLLAIVVWWLLERLTPATPERRRIAALAWAALAISAFGWCIAWTEPVARDVALGLLRFYWFRLADVVVPFALAVAATAVLADDAACAAVAAGRTGWLRAAVAVALVADVAAQSAHWPLPGRTGLQPRADSQVVAAEWRDVCEWVCDHVPAGSRFLTPRGAASFTWRTGLPEVVSWKNSPQDARSLIEWRRRFVDCFSRDGSLTMVERSPAAFGAERLRDVAARYAADHAIVPTDLPCAEPLPFERLYANAAYAVYRLPPADVTGARSASPP
jgi:hypothetical protein